MTSIVPMPSDANIQNQSPSDIDDDAMLSNSQFLTVEETIRRRHRRILQLSRVYKDYYWALMSDLKSKHRDYVWNFGSPFHSEEEGKVLTDSRCAHSHSCNKKPMPMTKFCHSHILSDPLQVLYKGCAYVTFKSGSTVQTVCSKPILRSTTPSFCNCHLLRMKKSVARSLKQAGLGSNDSNRMAPLIHLIGAEFVNEILRKRRTATKSKGNSYKMEESNDPSEGSAYVYK